MLKFRIMGLIVILTFGIFSLLATSEPPVYYTASMELLSETNESYGQFAEVCPNEILQLRWNIPQGDSPTLNAMPSNSIVPVLVNKQIEIQGQLPITVKGKAKITMIYDERYDKIWEAEVTISTDVCTGYPMDIRGQYVGTLEQTLPEVATLNRNLDIYWLNGELRASLSSDNSNIRMLCKTSIEDDTLECIEEIEEKVTFKLRGKFTATDFTGTYEGIQKGSSFETAIKGTFSFVKEELP